MLIAVYGSLRKGMSNHDYLAGSQFKGVETVFGFEMFSLGNYPYVIRGDSKATFEIYEVNDRTYRAIKSMELGANYEESQIETEFGIAKMYQMDSEQHGWYGRRSRYSPVEHGDWRKHIERSNSYGMDMYEVLTTSNEGVRPRPMRVEWNEGVLRQITDEDISNISNDVPF